MREFVPSFCSHTTLSFTEKFLFIMEHIIEYIMAYFLLKMSNVEILTIKRNT